VVIRSGEKMSVNLKLETARGLALIRSTPPNADVELDGTFIGQTPLFLPEAPLGEHRLTVKATGYLPKTIDFLLEDRTPKSFDIALQTDSARVRIESSPSEATVILDGADIGRTPLDLPTVPSGTHKLEITVSGHLPYLEELVLKAGDERRIMARLKSKPGSLTVHSNPDKVRIFINDQFAGETPFASNTIPAGLYTIRAELKGHETQVRANEILVGGKSTVEFVMTKNSGVILLTTEPGNVTIFIDGEKVGTTTASESGISQQLTLEDLSQGQHKIQLVKPGYFEVVKTVEVQANQPSVLHCKLVARPTPFVPNIMIRTGIGAENTFKGVLRNRYSNGDVQVEIEPGIFRTFKAREIQAQDPIKPQ